MYITNPSILPKNKIYKCNQTMAEYLIYNKQIPLLSRDGEFFIFSITKKLEEALKDYIS